MDNVLIFTPSVLFCFKKKCTKRKSDEQILKMDSNECFFMTERRYDPLRNVKVFIDTVIPADQ